MGIFDDFEDIVQTDVPLGPMTTFGVGGPAKHFARPRDEDELSRIVAEADEAGLDVYAIGRGSNILVRDEGVEGLVVQLDRDGFGEIEITEDLVRAGAAVPLGKLVEEAARHKLSGVECLVGVPGSVGGGVRMNAGGKFGDIGQTVERVKVMDSHGQTFYRERDGLAFGYRTSNISARFVLEAELRLVPETEKEILARMRKVWIAKRNSQPTDLSSAGCVFRNPRGMSAGALIDQAGLKGETVGGAMVSHKHANYIVIKDRDKATASDVIELIEKIRKAVKERFDVYLELEVKVWP